LALGGRRFAVGQAPGLDPHGPTVAVVGDEPAGHLQVDGRRCLIDPRQERAPPPIALPVFQRWQLGQLERDGGNQIAAERYRREIPEVMGGDALGDNRRQLLASGS
jgi:hypothetical protein